MTQCSGASEATECKLWHCLLCKLVIWLHARNQQCTLQTFENVLLATANAICAAEISTGLPAASC